MVKYIDVHIPPNIINKSRVKRKGWRIISKYLIIYVL